MIDSRFALRKQDSAPVRSPDLVAEEYASSGGGLLVSASSAMLGPFVKSGPALCNIAEMLSPCLALCEEVFVERVPVRMGTDFFHVVGVRYEVVDPLAEAKAGAGRGTEIEDLWLVRKKLQLLDFVSFLIHPSDVAAGENIAWAGDGSGETIASTWSTYRIIEARSEEVRHRHAANGVSEVIGLSGIAGFDEIGKFTACVLNLLTFDVNRN
jgi:hypothetical protein